MCSCLDCIFVTVLATAGPTTAGPTAAVIGTGPTLIAVIGTGPTLPTTTPVITTR